MYGIFLDVGFNRFSSEALAQAAQKSFTDYRTPYGNRQKNSNCYMYIEMPLNITFILLKNFG